MSIDKVTYTFVKQDGNISFRSKVDSFNLDHVTEKDSISFFKNFSNYAAFDSGLLPVDGTGLLAIRRAGNHTQVTYQHKPGLYYVNWGSHEGDRRAVSYLVAQPYRIVIIDFVDDNLLGARTFYSPIPATHPAIQLYHVNLPNINCRGYRGNGVGWICLYHNADWSQMPFNERLTRALERCSGIETYNDANMSETDGPRFYSDHYSHNSSFDYLWSPKSWEAKSQAEGFEWTLDDNLWVPIMVKSRDDQGQHCNDEDAVPFTLADAIVGKYNAYYGDSYHPKPINALTNPSMQIESSHIMNWFVQSYNSSTTKYVGVDTMAESAKTRETIATVKNAKLPLHTSDDVIPNDDDEQDDNSIQCSTCKSYFHEDDVSYVELLDQYNCQDCLNENFIFCENTSEYLPSDSENIYYVEPQDFHVDLSAYYNYKICSSCSNIHGVSTHAFHNFHKSNWRPNIWTIDVEIETPDGFKISTYEVCSYCIDGHDHVEHDSCHYCTANVPSHQHSPIENLYKAQFDDGKANILDAPLENNFVTGYVCSHCTSQKHSYRLCACGSNVPSYAFRSVANPQIYQVSELTYPNAYRVITDQLKSMDLEIFDDYLVTFDKFCTNCCYPSLLGNDDEAAKKTIINFDPKKYYWVFRDSKTYEPSPLDDDSFNLKDLLNQTINDASEHSVFSIMLNNGSFSIVPLAEAI